MATSAEKNGPGIVSLCEESAEQVESHLDRLLDGRDPRAPLVPYPTR